jgi:hypothetical protein
MGHHPWGAHKFLHPMVILQPHGRQRATKEQP